MGGGSIAPRCTHVVHQVLEQHGDRVEALGDVPQLVLGALQSLRVPTRLMLVTVTVDRDGRPVLFGHLDSRRLRRSGSGGHRFDDLRRRILRRRFLVSIGFDRRRRRRQVVV